MFRPTRSLHYPNNSIQVGPVAPLADACAPVGTSRGSATTAVASWVAAGMPKNKIVLGVATYGRAWSVKKSLAYSSGITIASNPPFDAAHTPYVPFAKVFRLVFTRPFRAGDSWDGTPATGVWFFQGKSYLCIITLQPWFTIL